MCISTYELYRHFNNEAQTALSSKLAQFDEWGVEYLAILFDDMRGDLSDLTVTEAIVICW